MLVNRNQRQEATTHNSSETPSKQIKTQRGPLCRPFDPRDENPGKGNSPQEARQVF